MSLEHLTSNWRPGSHDWSWEDEYRDLISDPVTAAVRRRVDVEGIGFQDHIAPILLGNDGRVWDGHHRIVIAMEREIEKLNVEVVR